MTDLTPFLLPPAIIAAIIFGIYFGYVEGDERGYRKGLEIGHKREHDTWVYLSNIWFSEYRQTISALREEIRNQLSPLVKVPPNFFENESLNNTPAQ
jgi:hypothetical protein